MTVTLRLVFACLLLPSIAGGCSLLQSWKAKAEQGDVAKAREERRSDVAGDLDRRHARAQLQAAIQAAELGDYPGAERAFQSVVKRDPGNVQARLLFAELYMSSEEWDKAEEQLREAIGIDPNRAELHHALALVLDAQGSSEARQHLVRAVELEPSNGLYQMALQAIDMDDSALQPASHQQDARASGRTTLRH